jgi:hypothetical protein
MSIPKIISIIVLDDDVSVTRVGFGINGRKEKENNKLKNPCM